MYNKVIVGMIAVALISTVHGEVSASDQDRISALEKQVQYLSDEIELRDMNTAAPSNPMGGFRFGGYGDVHANFEENGNSMFDIHRLVMYVGYDFADWIVLSTEIEVEHAFVAEEDAGGEISVEQVYVDFLLSDAVNVRAGRVLAPIGIINQNHEPTLFFGVERPSLDKNIIPSTWSLDGIGIFGAPFAWLNYQAYVVGGLDGSQFRASDGVRKGRIKERSGLNDPAVTGRIDVYPSEDIDLRLGVSGYYGGTDNVNEGGGNGVDNTFTLYSADFQYNVSRFRFRGVVAHGENSDAADLETVHSNQPGEEIFGWYLEGGVSVMPDTWKEGKLAEADIIPFVRYEEYDTHYKVPSNVAKDESRDRTEITVGVNFPMTQQFVLKADYQFRYSEAANDPNNAFNLGMGWAF